MSLDLFFFCFFKKKCIIRIFDNKCVCVCVCVCVCERERERERVSLWTYVRDDVCWKVVVVA